MAVSHGGVAGDAGDASARALRELKKGQPAAKVTGTVVLALHLAVVGLAGWFATMATAEPHRSTTPQCRLLLRNDDLVHLPLRRTHLAATKQLDRWKACDRSNGHRDATVKDARRAIGRDWWLIGTLGAGFALAFASTFFPKKRQRWHLAALGGGLLAVVYLGCDVTENIGLLHFLDSQARWGSWLPWVSAVKFGAFVGALPLFFVSLAGAASDVSQVWSLDAWEQRKKLDAELKDWSSQRCQRSMRLAAVQWAGRVARKLGPHDRASGRSDSSAGAGAEDEQPGRIRQVVRRLRSRLGRWITGSRPSDVKDEPETPPEETGGLGICASGGGIRSAAFNLGAFQALQQTRVAGTEAREMDNAKWLSAVSGGSYIATAWVTARYKERHAASWNRLSPEEDHLRRNASYLAPGFAGKIWALARFLFGFFLNLLLVTLVLAVIWLPIGWGIDRAEVVQPVTAGLVTLPQGGCLRLPSGAAATVLPDNKLHLVGGQRVRATRLLPPDKAKGAEPTASVNVTDDGKAAKADVSGSGTASARTDLGDGRQASADASIPAPTSTTAPSTTTTTQPPSSCPAAPVVKHTLALGRRLKKGARVTLATRPSTSTAALEVTGNAVTGCTENLGRTSVNTADCTRGNAHVFVARKGTLLVSAPQAVLTLGRSSVVAPKGVLARPCGARPCEKFHRPWQLTAAVEVMVGITLLVGVALVVSRAIPATASLTEWAARRLTTLTLFGVLAVFIVPMIVVWGERDRAWLEDKALRIGITGTLAVLVAIAAQVAPYLRAGSVIEDPTKKALSAVKKLAPPLRRMLVRLVGGVVGPLVVVVIAVAFGSYAAQQHFQAGQLGMWLALFGAVFVIGSGADLNEWSMHPFYRDRLRSAFAIDPRHWPPNDPREDRLDEFRSGVPHLLICAAANVADRRVSAPGRPVVSWTFDAGGDENSSFPARLGSRALGKAKLGYADRSTVMPSELPPLLRHLSWAWTAVAVSGAAFSPAMGKMTTSERFLLALGNLRLGVWYPNPVLLADPDQASWYDVHHPRAWYLLKEAVGYHRADDWWLYLTDGGHYENLGLVELLHRGCKEIYCFDASGDRPDTFGTLADAMRLAREELNVEIKIDPEHLKPDKETGVSKVGVWAGTICYPEDKDEPSAWLVVAKLAVPGTAPFDVIDLARTLPSFPNNPTADQLYTDQKFEAYRALGHYLGERALLLARDIKSRHENEPLSQAVENANKAQEGMKEQPDSGSGAHTHEEKPPP